MGKLKYVITGIFFVLSFNLFSQKNNGRFFIPGQDAELEYSTALQRTIEATKEYESKSSYKKTSENFKFEDSEVLHIPVVFHILSLDNSVDLDPFNVETSDAINVNVNRHVIEQTMKYVNSRLRNEYLDRAHYSPSAGFPGSIEFANQWYNETLGFEGGDVSPIWAAEIEPSSVDVGIEFHLATIDPSGNPTDGIVRHNMSDNLPYRTFGITTNNFYFSDEFGVDKSIDDFLNSNSSATVQFGVEFARRRALRDSFKSQGYSTTGIEIMRDIGWPSANYLNIFIVDEIDNLGTICSNPGICCLNTPNEPTENLSLSDTQYGVVYPASKLTLSTSRKSGIHETSKDVMVAIAQYFNLLPVYAGYDNCEDLQNAPSDPLYGDGVADTKPTTVNKGCGIYVNECFNSGCSVEDYPEGAPDFQNYMDGSSCARRFTPGQVDRWRADILENKSTMLNDFWKVDPTSNVTVDLSVNRTGYYEYEPVVHLKNTGSEIINTYEIEVHLLPNLVDDLRVSFSNANLGPIYPDEDFVVRFPEFQLVEFKEYVMNAQFSSDEDLIPSDNNSTILIKKERDLEISTQIRTRNYNPGRTQIGPNVDRDYTRNLRSQPFIWAQRYSQDTNNYTLRSFIAPPGNIGGYSEAFENALVPYKTYSTTTYSEGIDIALNASQLTRASGNLDFPTNPDDVVESYRTFYKESSKFIERDSSIQLNVDEKMYLRPGSWEINIMNKQNIVSIMGPAPLSFFNENIPRIGTLFSFFSECQDPDAPVFAQNEASGYGGVSQNIDPDDCFFKVDANSQNIFELDATDFNIKQSCFNPDLERYSFNPNAVSVEEHNAYNEWRRDCLGPGGFGNVITNWQAGLSFFNDSLNTFIYNNENPDNNPYRFSITRIINTEDYESPDVVPCDDFDIDPYGNRICMSNFNDLNPAVNLVELEFNPPDTTTIKLGVSVVEMGYIDSDSITFEISTDPSFNSGVISSTVLLNKINKLAGSDVLMVVGAAHEERSRLYDANQSKNSPNPSTYYVFENLDLNNTYYYRISLGERLIFAGEKDYVGSCPGLTTTHNGVVYELTSIGNQCWLKRELATDKFNNGDPIKNAHNVFLGTETPNTYEDIINLIQDREFFLPGDITASYAEKGITFTPGTQPYDSLSYAFGIDYYDEDFNIIDTLRNKASKIIRELQLTGRVPWGIERILDPETGLPIPGDGTLYTQLTVQDTMMQVLTAVEFEQFDEWVNTSLGDITEPMFKIPYESYRNVIIGTVSDEPYINGNFGTGESGDGYLTEEQYGWKQQYSSYPNYKLNDRGYIYNYATIVDDRGICPAGFRVPSHHDIKEFYDYTVAGDFNSNFLFVSDENPNNNYDPDNGEPINAYNSLQGFDSYNFDFKPFPALDPFELLGRIDPWRIKIDEEGKMYAGLPDFTPGASGGNASDIYVKKVRDWVRGSNLLEATDGRRRGQWQRWVIDAEKMDDRLAVISSPDVDGDSTFWGYHPNWKNKSHGLWLWDMEKPSPSFSYASRNTVALSPWYGLQIVHPATPADTTTFRAGPLKLHIQNHNGLTRFEVGNSLTPDIDEGYPDFCPIPEAAYGCDAYTEVDPPYVLPPGFWDNGRLGMLNIPKPNNSSVHPKSIVYLPLYNENDTISTTVSNYTTDAATSLWKTAAMGRGVRCVSGGNEVDYTTIVGNQISQAVEGGYEFSDNGIEYENLYKRMRAVCDFDVTANINSGERPKVWNQCEQCGEESITLDDIFCDCEGNVYDAIGICGGTCLNDFDNDGICDDGPNSGLFQNPCQGENVLTYQFYDYELVEIANQCWFAENLRAPLFNDNSNIQGILNSNDWKNAEEPSYTLAENSDGSFNQDYGFFYNWYAVETGKLCPSGWHVPGDKDWNTLERNLGVSENQIIRKSVRGEDALIGNKLKPGGISNMNLGLNGLRVGASGKFKEMGNKGLYWSSTDAKDSRSSRKENAIHRGVTSNSSGILRYSDSWSTSNTKKHGLNVRCLKDSQ